MTYATPVMATTQTSPIDAPVACVNAVALHRPGETLDAETLRQRACTELLRQAAIAAGLLEASDSVEPDGITSEAASAAIDALIEREIALPEPSDEACRRHYQAHAADYSTGEKVQMRHILFGLTPGMDVVALRNRAETCLLDVRCHDGTASDGFARSARALSNCPSGADGGDLGWLAREQVAPELARELFGQNHVGVLPRLVHSRFGLHVVEVMARAPGADQPFEAVRGAVAMALRQQGFVTALRQYLQLLVANAQVNGIDLAGADGQLVQ